MLASPTPSNQIDLRALTLTTTRTLTLTLTLHPHQVQQLATMDMALPSQARFVLDAPTAKETAAAAETIAADAATGAPSVEP